MLFGLDKSADKWYNNEVIETMPRRIEVGTLPSAASGRRSEGYGVAAVEIL